MILFADILVDDGVPLSSFQRPSSSRPSGADSPTRVDPPVVAYPPSAASPPIPDDPDVPTADPDVDLADDVACDPPPRWLIQTLKDSGVTDINSWSTAGPHTRARSQHPSFDDSLLQTNYALVTQILQAKEPQTIDEALFQSDWKATMEAEVLSVMVRGLLYPARIAKRW